MSTHTASPYHLAAGEGRRGPAMSWFTARFALKASDQQIGLMELKGSPGVEPPLDVHRNEDEYYYLLDGTVTFHVGDEPTADSPGRWSSSPCHPAHLHDRDANGADAAPQRTRRL